MTDFMIEAAGMLLVNNLGWFPAACFNITGAQYSYSTTGLLRTTNLQVHEVPGIYRVAEGISDSQGVRPITYP
jgi:hypothetical protein